MQEILNLIWKKDTELYIFLKYGTRYVVDKKLMLKNSLTKKEIFDFQIKWEI